MKVREFIYVTLYQKLDVIQQSEGRLLRESVRRMVSTNQDLS